MQQISGRKSFRNTLLVGAMLGSMIVGTSRTAEAAPRVHPLTVVPVTLPDAIALQTSSGGNSVVASDATFESQHLDIDTGVGSTFSNETDATRQPAGPNFAVGLTGTEVLRRNVTTGALERFSLDAPDWSPTGAPRADESGRYVAFDAANGALAAARAFVYDTQNASLLPWSTDGLVVDGNQSNVIRIGADGSYILTRDRQSFALVRWSLPSGATSLLQPPAEQDAFAGLWTASPDLNWSLFAGSTAGIVSGLDATTRLYRRDNRTGATDAVPVDIADVTSYQVTNGGRVIVVADVDGPDTDQLMTWDGGSTELVILSVAPDGTEADAPISTSLAPVSTNDDGTTITFASFASNLHPGGTLFERDFYQATLPTLTKPSTLAANGKVCPAVQGADPGDWVTVNITPVDATTGGFGTLHSSDNSPGGTANVNFGLGTIDPNTATTTVGSDGNICFTNSEHGPVNVIIDQLSVASATTFTDPTPTGAVRISDTRVPA